MFGTQYYFCSMFYTENWIVVRVKLTVQFLWRCNFAIDCVVKMLLWECTWCSVHISVRFLYVQNRKSFCHCRMQLRRCKSLKPGWFWLMLRKMCFFLLQASRRHDQDSWCWIFVTQLVTVALLVLYFSHMRQVCF